MRRGAGVTGTAESGGPSGQVSWLDQRRQTQQPHRWQQGWEFLSDPAVAPQPPGSRLPVAPATMLSGSLPGLPFLLGPSSQGLPLSQPDHLPEAPYLPLPLLSLHRLFTSEFMTLCMRMGPGMYLNPTLPPQSEPAHQAWQSSPGHWLGLPPVRAADQGPRRLHSVDQCCRTELPVTMKTHPGEEPLATCGPVRWDWGAKL